MTDHRNETPKKDKFVTLRKKKKRKGLSFGNELFRLSELFKNLLLMASAMSSGGFRTTHFKLSTNEKRKRKTKRNH